MKRTVEPKVLYFGTPVVLISSRNPDGSTNLSPMSSAWWLGYTAMLGMGRSAQAVKNLTERPEAVLNLVDPDMVAALDRIALLTGSEDMSDAKRARGYRYEPDKFAAAGLTREPSDLVDVDAVQESPINLEGRIVNIHEIGDPESRGGHQWGGRATDGGSLVARSPRAALTCDWVRNSAPVRSAPRRSASRRSAPIRSAWRRSASRRSAAIR